MPDSPNDETTGNQQLRHAAEERLAGRETINTTRMRRKEIQDLVGELELRQAELELQNDELRRTQQELTETRDRFQDLYEHAPVGYLTLDDEAIIRQVNEAAFTYCNRDRHAIVGQRVELLMVREDRDTCFDLLQQALDTGATVTGELRLKRADKRLLWTSVQVSILVDTDRAYQGFRVTLSDMTERRQAEAALRESEQQLRELSETLDKRVAERTAQLEERTNQLRHLAGELTAAEHRERKRVAAVLHDELQQFLVAARMHLGRTRRHQDIETIMKTVEEANECIADAVNTSRSLTHQLRPPVLYEDGLVPALRWLIGEMKRRHHLEVTINAADGRLPLDDDTRVFLYECVRELLFNVVKHADTLAARIRVEREENLLRVIVEDDGAGFKLETQSESRGGLGLFSMRERLAAYGGEMIIDSCDGKGSRIALSLSLAELSSQYSTRAAAASARQARRLSDQRHGLRALVVDDHAIVRQGIANLLVDDDRFDHVAQAADGIQALEVMEKSLPDIVMIDVNMPRMNGVELTREVRRRWPQVGIIGLSVQDDEATVKSMCSAGANAFMSKSEDADQMIATILRTAAR